MKKEKRWLIAVSGGPDSMALLHSLHGEGYDCIAAHVNYHQRPESDAEAIMVKEFCNKNDIKCIIREFEEPVQGNFQNHARIFRYEFFREMVKEHQCIGVAVGHHLDDDLETYLFQKERKMQSEAVGLREYTDLNHLLVWRPFLRHSKEFLVSYCDRYKIPFAIDASNLESNYTRNRIRHSIENKEKLIFEMTLEKYTHQERMDKVDSVLKNWTDEVLLKDYSKIEDSIRLLVLRKWLSSYGVAVYDFSEKMLSELDRQILLNKIYWDFGEMKLYCDHGLVAIKSPKTYEYKVENKKFKCEEFSFEKSGEKNQGLMLTKEDFPLTVRTARAKDKISLKFGTKTLNRYFIDEKIPRFKRDSWLVIENAQNELIYVMGLGCDVHHYANNPNVFVIEY